MRAEQGRINFGLADRLELVARVQLGTVNRVSNATLKAVLGVIVDRQGGGAECWPSIERIAADAGVHKRTALRALAVLEELGLLMVTRDERDRRANRYAVVWEELAVRAQRPRATPPAPSIGGTMPPTKGGTVSPIGGMVSGIGGMVSGIGGTMPPQPKEPQQTTNNPTRAGGGDFEAIKAALAAVGIRRVEAFAREFAGRLEDVERAAAVYRLNRSKFDDAGAVVEFLRSGSWPVEGIRDPDDRAVSRSCDRNAAAERERLRDLILRRRRSELVKQLGRPLELEEVDRLWLEVEAELDEQLATKGPL